MAEQNAPLDKLKRTRALFQTRRSRTLPYREIASVHARRVLAREYPEAQHRQLPLVRSDCENVPRPCPYVSCRYNLYLDVRETGAITLNFPDREPEDMPPEGSCALDVAERGRATLFEVGRLMNFTRERTRQMQDKILRRAVHLFPNLRKWLD